ncbi:hypothetical protein FF1_007022 [Malus domestica]
MLPELRLLPQKKKQSLASSPIPYALQNYLHERPSASSPSQALASKFDRLLRAAHGDAPELCFPATPANVNAGVIKSDGWGLID